jgi:hypothetical protein
MVAIAMTAMALARDIILHAHEWQLNSAARAPRFDPDAP